MLIGGLLPKWILIQSHYVGAYPDIYLIGAVFLCFTSIFQKEAVRYSVICVRLRFDRMFPSMQLKCRLSKNTCTFCV